VLATAGHREALDAEQVAKHTNRRLLRLTAAAVWSMVSSCIATQRPLSVPLPPSMLRESYTTP